MTLQTTHPLAESRLAERAWALSNFLLWKLCGKIDLSPPYQRGAVWGLTRQRMLIRSLIEGLPIGSIVVNDRTSAPQIWPDASVGRAPSFAVIDGKQRLLAIFAWMSGDLTVPASWFPPELVGCYTYTGDGPYVDIDGLASGMRSRWENKPLSTLEARVSTLDEEREIFDRINFGGVPQGEADAGSEG